MDAGASPAHARGFTLIELVVAMVIGGILVAIAIPAYSNYVLQSHRTDAKTALLDLASLEERYFSTTNTYTTVTANLGYPTGNNWPVVVGSGYYQVQTPVIVAATTAAPASYSITAVPVPGGYQTKDTACASFTVTSTGTQTALNSGGTDNSQTCWH
jgi:type IV pilus assembly protein PilE